MMGLAVVLLLISFSLRSTADDCSNYLLVIENTFPLDPDMSHLCSSGDCVVLLGYRAVSNQDVNYWCYKKEKAVYVYTTCFQNVTDVFSKKQVKFKCSYKSSGDCSAVASSKACLDDWMKFCGENDFYQGCIEENVTLPTSTFTPQPTVSSSTDHSSTEDITDPTSTTENDSQTTGSSALPTVTNSPSVCVLGSCLPGECFFQDHCYFMALLYQPVKHGAEALAACTENGSLASGLVVDSTDEESFIWNLLQESGIHGLVLTAGKGTLAHHSLPQPSQPRTAFPGLLFLNASSQGIWIYLPDNTTPISAVMCEHEVIWSMVLPDLRNSCLALYKDSNCTDTFCCALDSEDQIWFSCGGPREVVTKTCSGDPERNATWICDNGSFASEAPNTSACRCSDGCNSSFEGRQFIACPGKYAYSKCPDKREGYQRWLCLENGTFEGPEPSLKLCCDSSEPYKRQDPFLNVWMACPNTTVTRYTDCLVGSELQAEVSWKCGPSGFVGPLPDYSHCCKGTCRATDSHGVLWTTCRGKVAHHPCPDNLAGQATWTCGRNSTFLGNSPDYSGCYPSWVDCVQDMISNRTEAGVIMRMIHQKMEEDFFGQGLEQVLNVTSLCIDLFLAQNPGNGTIDLFDNFTGYYVRVLNDVVKNVSSLTLLSIGDREKNMREAINMTERLAFSLLKIRDIDDKSDYTYSNSYQADSNSTGVNLWLAYTNNLTEIHFSSAASESNCSVDLHSMTSETSPVSLFAAVGIIFPAPVASVAFPVRNLGSKTMNSAVLSMTVSDVSSGEPIKQENVSMKVTFEHAARARYPAKTTISRRLHEGERPSPIITASRCFYYDTAEFPGVWSDSGCEVTLSTSRQTVCECHHLSSFSVLVDMHEYHPNPALEVFSLVCSSLSILGLIITLIVFKALKSSQMKVDSDRNLIGINCCICLLASHFIIAVAMDKKFFYISDTMCSAVAGILHYVLMAAFFWMSVEGYHLYHLVVLVFIRERSYRSHYFIVGYVFPFIPIVLTELTSQVLQTPAYGRDELCWLQTQFIWSFDGPVFFLTLVNLLVIIIAMRAAITKKENMSFKTWWVWCKGLASLCTLLGVTWLVALVFTEEDVPAVFEFLFVLLNGLQGVYIFIFQCVLNNQVRPVLFQFCCRKLFRTGTSFSRKATVVSGDIDFSAKTGTSSLESSLSVKVVQIPSEGSGQWVFRTNTPRRDWVNRSSILPCDDVLRQLQARIHNNISSEIKKK